MSSLLTPETTVNRPVDDLGQTRGPAWLGSRLEDTGRVRTLAGLFLLVCISLCWISLGDHPIYDRSEGRYATTSRHMEESGDWLVPVFRGHPHLTKPPLTYWLQSAGIRLLGPTEWAVRLPTAIAGSVTLVMVMLLAWRLRGPRYALLVTGLLAVMPLQVMLSRIALTDGLLAMFWFGVLASALLAQREPARRGWWVTLMWVALAGAFITKGPPAILPLAVVVVWLIAAGRWRDLAWLKVWIGLPLALVPLMVWIVVILRTHPEALHIWHREIIDRATGAGDHVEPVWFFVPVFIVGLFPATAMFSLPGVHYPFSRLKELSREAAPQMLWALALVIPFIVFSINTGKLASYLLPLCPPLALLVGGVLESWFSGEYDRPQPGRHVPDFTIPLMVIGVGAVIVTPVVLGLLMDWSIAWMGVGILPTAAACVWVRYAWHRKPARRGVALLALWLTVSGLWIAGFEAEDMLRDPESPPVIVERAIKVAGDPSPTLVMFRFYDASMAFYYRGPLLNISKSEELLALMSSHPHTVVLVTLEDWERTITRDPAAAASFREVMRYGGVVRRDKTRLMLVPATHPRALGGGA